MARPIFEYDKLKKTWLRNGVAVKDGHRVTDVKSGDVYSYNSDGTRTKVMSKALSDKLILLKKQDAEKVDWGREAQKLIPLWGTKLEWDDYKAGKVGLGSVLFSGAADLASLASFGLAGAGLKAAATTAKGINMGTKALRAANAAKKAKNLELLIAVTKKVKDAKAAMRAAHLAGDAAKVDLLAANVVKYEKVLSNLGKSSQALDKASAAAKTTNTWKEFKALRAAKNAGTAPVSAFERHVLGMGGPRSWSWKSPLRGIRSLVTEPIKNPVSWGIFTGVNAGGNYLADKLSDGKYKTYGEAISQGMLGNEKGSGTDKALLFILPIIGAGAGSGAITKAGNKMLGNYFANSGKAGAAALLGTSLLGATYGNAETRLMAHDVSEMMHKPAPQTDDYGMTELDWADSYRAYKNAGYNVGSFNNFKDALISLNLDSITPQLQELPEQYVRYIDY